MDAVLYWNEVALEANKSSHTTGKDAAIVNGPTMSSRALAMVHLAMYDAYKGAMASGSTTLTPYLGHSAAIVSSSETAAIGAAALEVLSKLYPSQSNFFKSKSKDFKPLGTDIQIEEGEKYGKIIATNLLEYRMADIGASSESYTALETHGSHRQDPWDNKQGYHGSAYGKNSLFVTSARYGISTPPPASKTNAAYMRAYRQVRGLGIIPEQAGMLPPGALKRTTDQTLAGIFWAYDGAKELGTPPRLYNQIIRELAMANGNSLEKNLELFTLINVAMGDAGILAWEQKYKYNYWRPVVGLREHDLSTGPSAKPDHEIDTECDPLWLPLGAPNSNRDGSNNATPSFPAYPSGHATFGAATFRIAELFFNREGVDLNALFNKISFVSEEFDGKTKDNRGIIRPKHARKFTSFDDMIIENGLSRVYLGVHWSFDAFEVAADATKSSSAGGKNITNSEVDLTFDPANPSAVGLGGVPLGLAIAEDIFNGGVKKSIA